MAKYKVKTGQYVNKEGVVFKQGDIITSDKDLTKIFPQKFEVVEALVPPFPTSPPLAPIPPAAPKAVKEEEEEDDEEEEAPKAIAKAPVKAPAKAEAAPARKATARRG